MESKKIFFASFAVLAMAGAMVLSSCNKTEDYVYNPEKAHEGLVNEYKAAFVAQFGAISPNHHWGFEDGASTRAAATENYKNYKFPKVIKNSEGKNFASTFNPATKKVDLITYDEYFLQHVYKQTGNGTGSHGNESDTHHMLDQLQAYNFNTGQWENVTNFTNGMNVHHMTDSENYQTTKGVTLMTNMGTPVAGQPMFRWIGTDNYVCDNYVIKEINGEYYLGMGYNNDNKLDYDAWIIKIVKAVGIPPYKERGRIMCEDLGEIGDFDFNDVVFDAEIMNDGSINIEILASGGTLPISVAGVPVTLGTMTNTGERVNNNTQKFTISAATAATNGWTTLKKIPVEVTGKDGDKYMLTADWGEAPGKFCTFIGLPWADEYVNINDAYNGFRSWVRTEQPETWWQSHMSEILTDLDLSNNPPRP